MNRLDEKSLADLEVVAADLRQRIARNPQHPSVELLDVEWEIEKRNWRK
jgi:hypothetical protein